MRILITRPRDDAAAFAEKLIARGHEVMVEPMLDIRFLTGVTLPLDGVQAVLFTSANGVRAFAALEDKRDRPAYCVGDASAAAARAAGFTHVESATGNVEDLAALVRSRLKPENGALLHGAGANVAGDLAAALKKDGFDVRRVVLYSAEAVSALSPLVAAALKARSVDLVVFFSARTAENFVRLVRQAGLTPAVERTVALGLSPNVLEAAIGLPWAMMEAARRPQEVDMIRAIARHKIITQLEGSPAAEETADVSFGRRLEDAADKPAEGPSPGPKTSTPSGAPGIPPGKPPRNPTRLVAWLAVAVSLVSAAYVLTATPTGRLPDTTSPSATLRLETRLGALERQIAALPKPEASRADPRIDEILARLEALEKMPAPTAPPASPPPSSPPAIDESLSPRLSTLEDRLATLEQRSGSGSEAGQIAAAIAENRRLSNEVARLQEQIATLGTGATRGPREGLLLAVGQLREAARRGVPFGPELRTVQAFAAEEPTLAGALAPLTPLAERAVPTREALLQRFPSLAAEAARALQSAALSGNAPADTPLRQWWSGVADRLANIVSVRRVGETAGDSGPARLARAERAAAAGDLAATVAATDGIDAAAAQALAGWRADANQRLALDRGAEALLGAALAAAAR